MQVFRRFLALLALLGLMVWPSLPVLGQDSEEEEKSRFIRYVEEQLSAPNRQIRLNGIQGTLSSDVRFDSITIADDNGVWLTIVNPRLQWSRRALLIGRLDIESLTADRIDWPRMPVADDSVPAPESSGFSLPELPVAVTIDVLAVREARFGEAVFGLASVLSLDGRLSLSDGSLDTELDIDRLDGPGGELALTATYADASTQLDVDLSLREPDDGVVANLLKIPDRPSVALTIEGSGTLDQFEADLTFDVGDERTADGTFALAGAGSGGRLLNLDLSGPIARILPEEHRAFFGSETALEAEALLRREGGVDIRQLQLDSGALDIAASGSTLSDGFLSELAADVTLRSADAAPVRLPLSGEPITVENGIISVRYGMGGADNWTMTTTVNGIALPDAGIEELRINGSGGITGLNTPGNRAVSYTFDGEAIGIRPDDQAIAKAVGDAVTLNAEGDWSTGNSLRIARAIVTGKTLRIAVQGLIEELTFKGRTRIEASDLEAFSLVADRELAGSAALTTNGEVALAGGAFDLDFDGTLTDAKVGGDPADRLLAGETTLSGRAARSPDGLSFHDFNIANNQVTARVDGTFATREADLRARAEIFDIATLTDSGSGRLMLDAAIDKPANSTRAAPFSVEAKLGLTQARLADRKVPEANIAFAGRITEGDIAGLIAGDGLIDGEPIDISGDLKRIGDRISLQDFSARIGLAQLTGDIAVENGLAEGNLEIAANDIASLAALALADASGALNGTVTLTVDDARQNASADVSASKLRYESYRIGSAEIEAVIRDLTGVPQIDAAIDGKAIKAAGVEISELAARASTQGETTDFTAKATLDNGTDVNADGSVTTTSDGFSATLDTLSAQSPYGDARLNAPARISRTGDVTRIEPFSASVAGGEVTASGTIGDTMDIRARIAALPLSIANGFRPDLGLGGTVDTTFDVSGPTDNPVAAFKIDGSGIDAAVLRTASISPISVSASGRYGDDTVRLDGLSATNAQNLDFSGSGTIPLSGTGLSVRVNGSAPLGLAERFLAERGTQVDGTVRIDATLTGSLASPSADGLFSIAGANVRDPQSNLRLENITGMAGLRGDTISINRLTGRLAGGGSLSVSGTIGLAGSLPANLDIVLSDATYSDGETIRTTLSGNLTLSGPLTAGPLLSGQIDLLGTEITIPETIGNEVDLLPVQHVAPDGGTLRTLNRIAAVLPKDDGAAAQAPIRLDVVISSPNRIFIRGRGIDAELGGRLRVTGPLDNLRPIGAFNLIRGRLSILSKRLQLTEGRVTLTGSLDPLINLEAQVTGDEIVAYVRLTGRASDLSLDLSSSPELPEDEILARVLFGKGISSLSPLQIANLATAAASLASGGSGAGLSEQIRQGIGVDDLDITQDNEGNVAVRAGKYIQDNVYLDVQAGQSGGEVSINLDVTDSLTAKGTVDTEGDSKLGIFFEKDY